MGSTGFVWAAGHTQLYNGQLQLIVEQLKPVQVGQDELAALLPSTNRNIDEMYGGAQAAANPKVNAAI